MKRILMVEDESSISDFVKLELEYEGYEVTIKEDGREGLKEAVNNYYDLVILDIMLPSMNGFEICRRLKKEKSIFSHYCGIKRLELSQFQPKKKQRLIRV